MTILNRTTIAYVDRINNINVVVHAPRPIQHSLQPSVHLATGLGAYKGGRKEREVVPSSSSIPIHYTRLHSFLGVCTTLKLKSFLSPQKQLPWLLKEHNWKVPFRSTLRNQFFDHFSYFLLQLENWIDHLGPFT